MGKTHPPHWLQLATSLSILLCILPFTLYTSSYVFLYWNLFLAILPTVFAYLFVQLRSHARYLGLAGWLAFFPNSIYAWTDIIHPLYISRYTCPTGQPNWLCGEKLIRTYSSPLWHGNMFQITALLVVLVFIGICIAWGRYSWKLICQGIVPQLRLYFGIFIIFATAFAVTLGRFARSNSWNIISNPVGLYYDIEDTLIKLYTEPVHAGTFIISALITAILLFVPFYNFSQKLSSSQL